MVLLMQYGLDTSEFTYNPSESHRFQQDKCVQEAETNNEDLLEKCAQITAALKQCMDAHSDYYEPILRAEKLAEEQAIIKLEKEKQDSLPNEPQPQPSSSQDQK
ncbi:hypothetical protein Fmac_027305 [Flemingia macrophylla]|uniref:GCK domain-containing protein n=1 Tax=Flemingia macrophylla TaxID=520843 RepID=A0ABD1LHK9_9FABA